MNLTTKTMKFYQVAHLYIGCKVKRLHEIHELFGTDGDLLIFYNDHDMFYGNATNTDWNKPLLFPLSAMSEEQLKEVVWLSFLTPDVIKDKYYRLKKYTETKHAVKFGTGITYHAFDINSQFFVSGIFSLQVLNPLQFKYLLDNHFDIFNLIESGEAIDVTTLEVNPYKS